eukprot:g1842.t1
MGNDSSTVKYDLVGGTSCGLDEGEPPPVLKPTRFGAVLARVEEVCCCLNADEIRRRRFDAHALPMISEGDVFVMQSWSPPCISSSKLGKVTNVFSRFFDNNAGAGELAGTPCLVTANRDFMLRWKSLELANNKSKHRGALPLHHIHHVRPRSDAPEEYTLEFVNAQGGSLLTLKADTEAKRDSWVSALSSFLSIYASKIESVAKLSSAKTEKQTRMESRRSAIEQRRLAAKAKIARLGLTGMQYSAKARMEV